MKDEAQLKDLIEHENFTPRVFNGRVRLFAARSEAWCTSNMYIHLAKDQHFLFTQHRCEKDRRSCDMVSYNTGCLDINIHCANKTE